MMDKLERICDLTTKYKGSLLSVVDIDKCIIFIIMYSFRGNNGEKARCGTLCLTLQLSRCLLIAITVKHNKRNTLQPGSRALAARFGCNTVRSIILLEKPRGGGSSDVVGIG